MHAAMQGRARLQERLFQKGLVVFVIVMSRGVGRVAARRVVAQVREPTFDQRQHVLGIGRAEQFVISADGNIDRRGVRQGRHGRRQGRRPESSPGRDTRTW